MRAEYTSAALALTLMPTPRASAISSLDRDHNGVRGGPRLILPHFRWKLFGGRGHRGSMHADQRQH
jgi:hypothetical protein